LYKEQIKAAYIRDMLGEYESIKPHLPPDVSTVLDIGCGVAGIDVLLHQHYQGSPNLQFLLLDRTEVNTTIYYQFHEQGAFYNSLSAAKETLEANGIVSKNIHLIEASEDMQIPVEQVDLVISLISWGFHYPVSTYVEKVWKHLNADGTLIIDIRKGSGGEAELATRFKVLSVILETTKFSRYLAQPLKQGQSATTEAALQSTP